MTKNKSFAIIFIILYTLIQIPFVIQPTINHYYSIMQSDRASVARNYYLESNDLFKPRVDVRGNFSGITGMEFPLYNYLISIFYKIFKSDWIGFGRIISYLFGLSAMYLIYLIFKHEIKDKNLYLYVFPAVTLTSFFYLISHSILPETFAMFFALLFFYFCYQKKSVKNYLIVLISYTLAILIRPYYIFFGIPIVLKILNNFKKKEFYIWLIIGIISLFIFYIYYFQYYPNLNNKFGLNYFYKGDFNLSHTKYYFSFRFLFDIIYVFGKRFVLQILPVFLFGTYIFLKKMKKLKSIDKPSIQLLLIAFFTIFTFPFVIGNVFVNHDYYFGACLPFISYLSILAFQKIYNKRKMFYYIVVIVLFASLVLINSFRFREREDFKWLNNNKMSLLKGTNSNDLFVIDGSNPALMYTIERKGWLFSFSTQNDNTYSKPDVTSYIFNDDELHYNYNSLIIKDFNLNNFQIRVLFKFYNFGAKYALIQNYSKEHEFFFIDLHKFFQRL